MLLGETVSLGWWFLLPAELEIHSLYQGPKVCHRRVHLKDEAFSQRSVEDTDATGA
jgi:uncharacterized RDD family membrane protein YckC